MSTYQSATDAFTSLLEAVLKSSSKVLGAPGTKSIGADQATLENLHVHFTIENPLDRVVARGERPFNLPGATARFVWMMAGNERLKDIEFYWGKVITPFSDDGLVVPGSNYGHRIFHSRPGLDQLDGCITRLQGDPGSRRAVMAIYQPDDTVRISKDIPCTFGLSFHVREGQLRPGVVMRSNNAYVLMPYNIFEFSLLAEIVAAELKLEMEPLSYYAMSMHIYEKDLAAASQCLKSPMVTKGAFPAMPRDDPPLKQVKQLVLMESELRHNAARITDAVVEALIREAGDRLHPYWCQYYFQLLLHVARPLRASREAIRARMVPPWNAYVPDAYFTGPKENAALELIQPSAEPKSLVVEVDSSTDYKIPRRDSLLAHCDSLRGSLSYDEYRQLESMLMGESELALAARSRAPIISAAEFQSALAGIRGK